MSYLMRNGTGRNNIVYGGSASTNGNYLRRTSTGRNNISFINISNTNTTINALERYNTSRNSIRWNNIAFSFGNIPQYSTSKIIISDYMYNFDNSSVKGASFGYLYYTVSSYLPNGYKLNYTEASNTYYHANSNCIIIILPDYSTTNNLYNYINEKYSKISFIMSNNTQYSKNITNLRYRFTFGNSTYTIGVNYSATSGNGLYIGTNGSIHHTQITFS